MPTNDIKFLPEPSGASCAPSLKIICPVIGNKGFLFVLIFIFLQNGLNFKSYQIRLNPRRPFRREKYFVGQRLDFSPADKPRAKRHGFFVVAEKRAGAHDRHHFAGAGKMVIGFHHVVNIR